MLDKCDFVSLNQRKDRLRPILDFFSFMVIFYQMMIALSEHLLISRSQRLFETRIFRKWPVLNETNQIDMS